MSSGYVVWDKDPTADWSTQLCSFEIKPRWLRLSSKIIGFLRAQHEPMGDMFVSAPPPFSYLLLWGNNVLKACGQISASSKQRKIIPWESSDKCVKRRKTLFSVYQHFLNCVFQNILWYVKFFTQSFIFQIWILASFSSFLYTGFLHTFQCEHTYYRSMLFMTHICV